jgi:hypothetical protein
MPKEVKVTCDQCERNITSTSNCEGWRIALLNERIPSRGGLVTLMSSHPHLDKDCYFCSFKCLFDWIKRQ